MFTKLRNSTKKTSTDGQGHGRGGQQQQQQQSASLSKATGKKSSTSPSPHSSSLPRPPLNEKLPALPPGHITPSQRFAGKSQVADFAPLAEMKRQQQQSRVRPATGSSSEESSSIGGHSDPRQMYSSRSVTMPTQTQSQMKTMETPPRERGADRQQQQQALLSPIDTTARRTSRSPPFYAQDGPSPSISPVEPVVVQQVHEGARGTDLPPLAPFAQSQVDQNAPRYPQVHAHQQQRSVTDPQLLASASASVNVSSPPPSTRRNPPPRRDSLFASPAPFSPPAHQHPPSSLIEDEAVSTPDLTFSPGSPSSQFSGSAEMHEYPTLVLQNEGEMETVAVAGAEGKKEGGLQVSQAQPQEGGSRYSMIFGVGAWRTKQAVEKGLPVPVIGESICEAEGPTASPALPQVPLPSPPLPSPPLPSPPLAALATTARHAVPAYPERPPSTPPRQQSPVSLSPVSPREGYSAREGFGTSPPPSASALRAAAKQQSQQGGRREERREPIVDARGLPMPREGRRTEEMEKAGKTSASSREGGDREGREVKEISTRRREDDVRGQKTSSSWVATSREGKEVDGRNPKQQSSSRQREEHSHSSGGKLVKSRSSTDPKSSTTSSNSRALPSPAPSSTPRGPLPSPPTPHSTRGPLPTPPSSSASRDSAPKARLSVSQPLPLTPPATGDSTSSRRSYVPPAAGEEPYVRKPRRESLMQREQPKSMSTSTSAAVAKQSHLANVTEEEVDTAQARVVREMHKRASRDLLQDPLNQQKQQQQHQLMAPTSAPRLDQQYSYGSSATSFQSLSTTEDAEGVETDDTERSMQQQQQPSKDASEVDEDGPPPRQGPAPFEIIMASYPNTIFYCLLEHLDYYDFRALPEVSRMLRRMLTQGEAKEVVLDRYLGEYGYRTVPLPRGQVLGMALGGAPSPSPRGGTFHGRKTSTDQAVRASRYGSEIGHGTAMPLRMMANGAKETIPNLTLRDLDAFIVGQRFTPKDYALCAKAHKSRPLDLVTFNMIRAAMAAHNNLLLRVRAQPAALTHGPGRTYGDGKRGLQLIVSSFRSKYDDVAPPSCVGITKPLTKAGRALVLHVWVPCRTSWMADDELVECERELWRSGSWTHLRRADVIWNVAIGDFANEGKLLFDGKYLRDLAYTYDHIGHMPNWINMLAFSPSYFHNIVVASSPDPVLYLDLTPFHVQIVQTMRLYQDKVDVTSPQGRYRVQKYVYRSQITVSSGTLIGSGGGQGGSGPGGIEVVNDEWTGQIVLETEGTTEHAQSLVALCTPKQQTPAARFARQDQKAQEKDTSLVPWRIIRDRSRPGKIWIRPVFASEQIA